MLSRVAESIYWMSRYVERAENVARFINVNLQLALDSPPGKPLQWQPLVDATGDEKEFAANYREATQENVIQFLTFDLRNPNSILSCLHAARENARGIREIISSAMWLRLNQYYLMVKSAAAQRVDLDIAAGFFDQVILGSQTFTGVTDATMSHGKGWHFAQIGRLLERADKSSRILDVKYYILPRSPEDIGGAYDYAQWGAVLRSASAFEMYCKRRGRVCPGGVIEFLMLDQEFPRSVRFCLLAARDSVQMITGDATVELGSSPQKTLQRICSSLATITAEDIIRYGVHEYIDQLQSKLNQTGQAIHDRFFAAALAPAKPESPNAPPAERSCTLAQ